MSQLQPNFYVVCIVKTPGGFEIWWYWHFWQFFSEIIFQAYNWTKILIYWSKKGLAENWNSVKTINKRKFFERATTLVVYNYIAISFHSSEIRGLCLMKWPGETLQNLPYLIYAKTQISFFLFSFCTTLCRDSNFGYI